MGIKLSPMKVITFQASKFRLALGLLGALSFVYLLRYWILHETQLTKLVFAVFAIVFFGAAALRFAYLLASQKEKIAITDKGLILGAWSGVLKWDDFEEIFLASQKVTPVSPTYKYICFNMKPSWVDQDQRSWGKRALSRINLRLGYGYFTVGTIFYAESHKLILSKVFDAFELAVRKTERTVDWCGLVELNERADA